MALHCKLIYFINYKQYGKWYYKPIKKELNENNSPFPLNEYTKFYLKDEDNVTSNIVKPYTLFEKYIDGHKCYYADNDGFYLIKLSKNHNIAYIKLKITPIPLNKRERRAMINDLEKFSIGETRQPIHGTIPTYGYKDKISNKINGNIYKHLANKALKLIIDFKYILYEPSITIKNKYILTKHPKIIDYKVFTKDSIINNPNKKFSRIKNIDYDTEENRWIKYISIQFIHYLRIGKIYFSNKLDLLNKNHKVNKIYNYYINSSERRHNNNVFILSKDEYNNLISNIKKLYNYLTYINNNTFLKHIINMPSYIPKKLILSSKYNDVYKTYQNILCNKLTFNNRHYKYLAKSSQNLYEMWTTLTILKALKMLNFSINTINNVESIKYYGLQKGDQFYLNKNSLHLIVNYNKSIKNSRLLHMKKGFTNNKPDIRLDIFQDKNYIGSIIFDAKFMYAGNIVSHRTLKQFKSYKTGITSPALNINKNLQNLENKPKDININPIHDVFALFPNYRPSKITVEKSLHNNYFKYQKLTPAKDLNTFKNILNKDIKKYLLIYRKFLSNQK